MAARPPANFTSGGEPPPDPVRLFVAAIYLKEASSDEPPARQGVRTSTSSRAISASQIAATTTVVTPSTRS